MKRRSKLLRPITKLAKSGRRQFRSTSQALSKTTSVLFRIRETPVVTGGGVTRQKPSWTNYFNPLFWIQQCFGFISRFFRSRNVIAAIQGVPAMLGFVALVIAAFWLVESVDERTQHAEDRMDYHAQQNELEEAEFYARQLCILLEGKPEVLFARAKLLDRIGEEKEVPEESDKARAIVAQLVNDEHLPAVEWLSRKELIQLRDAGVPDPEREQQLEKWLTWIVQEQPQNAGANLMLGTLRMMRKQYMSAIRPLQTATRSREMSTQPEAWYSLAVCQKISGDIVSSRRNAANAADMFLARDARQTFDLKRSVQTLRAMVLAAREEEAAMLIRQVIGQRPEEERNQLLNLLGEVYAERSKRLRRKDNRSAREFAEAMASITNAIKVAPNNPVVTEELVQLTCSRDVDDRSMESQLTIAQDSGVATGLIHFIRGTRQQLADPPDPVAADSHFKIAEQRGLNLPGLWNNMADAMFENQDEDLDAALALVNKAILTMPDEPYFFDTRGKILLRQQKTVEAIADLERALAAPALRESVHAALAEAWHTLGNQTEADRHRDLATQIRQANAVNEPPRTVTPVEVITPKESENTDQALPEPAETGSPIEQTVVDSL